MKAALAGESNEAKDKRKRTIGSALSAGSVCGFRLGRGGDGVGRRAGMLSIAVVGGIRAPLRWVVIAVISVKPPSSCSHSSVSPSADFLFRREPAKSILRRQYRRKGRRRRSPRGRVVESRKNGGGRGESGRMVEISGGSAVTSRSPLGAERGVAQQTRISLLGVKRGARRESQRCAGRQEGSHKEPESISNGRA